MDVAERKSIKLCHIFESELCLILHVNNLKDSLVKPVARKLLIFGWLHDEIQA